MWKASVYLLIAVIAIAVGPLMTYRLQTETDLNSQSMLVDHRSINKDHRQLTEKIAGLSAAVSEIQFKLQDLQTELDGLSGKVRSLPEPAVQDEEQ